MEEAASEEPDSARAHSVELDFAEPDPADFESVRPDPVQLALLEPGSQEPGPVPHTTAPSAPTRPQIPDLAIADSGNPPQDWRCTEQKPPSSVRTSKQRVKPPRGIGGRRFQSCTPLPFPPAGVGFRPPLARAVRRSLREALQKVSTEVRNSCERQQLSPDAARAETLLRAPRVVKMKGFAMSVPQTDHWGSGIPKGWKLDHDSPKE